MINDNIPFAKTSNGVQKKKLISFNSEAINNECEIKTAERHTELIKNHRTLNAN